MGKFDDICRLPAPVLPTYHCGVTTAERTYSGALCLGRLRREACRYCRKWTWDGMGRNGTESENLRSTISGYRAFSFESGPGCRRNGKNWEKWDPLGIIPSRFSHEQPFGMCPVYSSPALCLSTRHPDQEAHFPYAITLTPSSSSVVWLHSGVLG